MLKKKIQYSDLDGNTIVDEFYFNLTKAELIEMDFLKDGGMAGYLTRIVESEDNAAILAEFKKIITSSVGIRSEDGKRLIKSEEIAQGFLQSDAYSELFVELLQDASAMVAFIKAVVPKDIAEQANEGLEQAAKGVETVDVDLATVKVAGTADDRPAWEREDREPTNAEIREMSTEQLAAAMRRRAARAGA